MYHPSVWKTQQSNRSSNCDVNTVFLTIFILALWVKIQHWVYLSLQKYVNILLTFVSHLPARRCSWAWQAERGCGSSCSPARCCTWASPPGGVSPPAVGAGNPAAWLCLRSPPHSQTAPSERQWGTEGKHSKEKLLTLMSCNR